MTVRKLQKIILQVASERLLPPNRWLLVNALTYFIGQVDHNGKNLIEDTQTEATCLAEMFQNANMTKELSVT